MNQFWSKLVDSKLHWYTKNEFLMKFSHFVPQNELIRYLKSVSTFKYRYKNLLFSKSEKFKVRKDSGLAIPLN